MPVPYYPSTSPAAQPQQGQQTDYFVRRGSLPAPAEAQQRRPEGAIPEVTGWQTIPVSEMAPAKSAKSSPQIASKPVLAA